jgi:hypothetical protein
VARPGGRGAEGPLLTRAASLLFALLAGGALLVPLAPAGGRAPWYIGLHLALSACMLVAWRRGGALRWVLAAGIAARLVAAAAPAFTSNDSARYLWDGNVALAGLDPYRLAPDAPELEPLRAAWPVPPDNTSYPTLYPPGALAVFTAMAALGGPAAAPRLWELTVTAASIAALLWTASALRRAGQERHLALVALSPLLVLEDGVGAHVDALATASVAAALALWTRGAFARAGAALGAGALAKLLPAVAALPLSLSLPLPLALQGRGAWRVAAGAAALVAAGYAVAVAAGLVPFGSTEVFLTRWRFGNPLFALLETPDSAELSRAACTTAAAALLLASGAVATPAGGVRGAAIGVQLALAAPLVASPVVFPWYLAPLVPAVALAPSWTALLTLLAFPLTHEVIDRYQRDGVWAPAQWPLFAVALAIAFGALCDAALAFKSRAPSPEATPI